MQLVGVLPLVKYGVRSPKFIWAPCAQLYSLTETNDDLFDRLETVRFFRLFTGEGDMENTGPR